MSFESPQQPQRNRVLLLLVQPFIVHWRAWRNPELARHNIGVYLLSAVTALIGGLTSVNFIFYGTLLILGGYAFWLIHERVKQMTKTDGLTPFEQRLVYASGIILAFPIAYAELAVISFAAAIAFMVLILGVVGFVISLFVRKQRTQQIERGANSHFNANGSPKVEFFTVEEAQAAAADYERNYPGEKMNAYACGEGKHFHIGHA